MIKKLEIFSSILYENVFLTHHRGLKRLKISMLEIFFVPISNIHNIFDGCEQLEYNAHDLLKIPLMKFQINVISNKTET